MGQSDEASGGGARVRTAKDAFTTTNKASRSGDTLRKTSVAFEQLSSRSTLPTGNEYRRSDLGTGQGINRFTQRSRVSELAKDQHGMKHSEVLLGIFETAITNL